MENLELKEIKKIIKKYRKDNNLTQKNLAIKTGYKLNTVKKYESLKGGFSSTFLSVFLKKFKVKKEDKKLFLNYINSNGGFKKDDTQSNELTWTQNIKNDLNIIFSEALEKEISKFSLEINKKMELNKELEKAHKKLILKNNKLTPGDAVREKAFKNDFSNTSLIINRMWKLNNEINEIFGELELLLEINSVEENLKMKKGLTTVGKNLISKGEKIISYTKFSDMEVIEVDQN